MPSFSVISAALLVASHSAVASIPTWPSAEIDELEDIRFLQTGYNQRGFIDFVAPCSFSAAAVGRITAAEWLRTAYHDMATADVVAGTGGLDASIQFETDRAENIGAAMNDTLISMLGYFTPRSSMSDLLALGVFVGVANCGGPLVPYRVGRVDATVAGPTGVPEPTDELSTLQSKFVRQGFNTSEMIGLVACGHTVGGVHGEDFPTVVPGNGTAGHRFSHFDDTTWFDSHVANEYVHGNTTNPLVVGADPGKNSDLVVFNADGNKTISGLTDNDTFKSTCKSLLERMINTVPSSVELSDPLVPYPVKPASLQLDLSDDGTNLTFSGSLRVRTTVRPTSDIEKVQLKYCARDGATTGVIDCTKATYQSGITAGFGEEFQWYDFSSVLKATSAVSSFNVSITLTNGTVEEYTNNGVGFPVQSKVMLQSARTCRHLNGTDSYLQIYAAALKARQHLPQTIVTYIPMAVQGSVVPSWSTSSTSLAFVNNTGTYDFYTATIPMDINKLTKAIVDLVSGEGGNVEVSHFNKMNGIPSC